ncbi:hypothetical protein ACS0TY_020940 [Phlomoides rotata]
MMRRATPGSSSTNRVTSSLNNELNSNPELRCYCGYQIHASTSMIRRNPGRRFMSCPMRDDDKCTYFVWLDPEIPIKTLEILQTLYDRCDHYEIQLASNTL